MKSLQTVSVDAFPALKLNDNSYISYQLYFEVRGVAHVEVGKLGQFTFSPGSYVYTGSARRNLAKRVTRHLSPTKKLHWHIDYLLSGAKSVFSRIVISELEECELNRLTEGVIVVHGFGSTDCSAGCGSHLKFLGEVPRKISQTDASESSVLQG